VLLCGGILIVLWGMLSITNKSISQMMPYKGALIFLLLVIFILYFSTPKTLGKRFAKIAVIDKSGRFPNNLDMVIRSVFYLPDVFLSLGALSLISIFRDPHQRRLGDLIADTLVIKIPRVPPPSKSEFNLKAIPPITYPEVKKLPEELLLLVKEALNTYDYFPNQAHLEILEDTALRIAHFLHLNPTPEDSKLFLQTIVKDYITLTR
jgi:hypothetical protein